MTTPADIAAAETFVRGEDPLPVVYRQCAWCSDFLDSDDKVIEAPVHGATITTTICPGCLARAKRTY